MKIHWRQWIYCTNIYNILTVTNNKKSTKSSNVLNAHNCHNCLIDHFTDKETIYSRTSNVIEIISNWNGRMGVWQNNRMYLCLLAICIVIEKIWPMKTLQIQNMRRRNEMQSHFLFDIMFESAETAKSDDQNLYVFICFCLAWSV